MAPALTKRLASSIIVLVLFFDLSLGLTRLGSYSAVDEPYWTYGRISKFWTAVAQEKWRSTDINDKPGITVALLSGFGLLRFDPMAYKSLRGDVKTAQDISAIDAINFTFRLPIFLFCLALLPLFYVFLKRLFDPTVALIGFLLIALSPLLLGISMIINPDSLLWTFLPLSLLSYLVFQKEKDSRYLYASGVLIGLSLLTKYVSNILYIFFFLLPFLEYVVAEDKPPVRAFLKSSLRHFFLLVLVSMATFYVLYPATWTHPDVLLKGTFLSKAFETTWPFFAALVGLILADFFLFRSRATEWLLETVSRRKRLLFQIVIGAFLIAIAFVLLDTYAGMRPFDFEGTLASPKGIGSDSLLPRYSGAMLADVFALVFGLAPVALVGFLAALLVSLKKDTLRPAEAGAVLSFVLFIALYYLGSTVNAVAATVRYQIALYPLAFIVSAIGLSSILSSLKQRLPKISRWRTSVIPGLLTLLAVVLVAGPLLVRPFYFTYASPLLPQPYLLNTKDMGDGSYEAAQYLNALPQADGLSIWSDKGAVCAEFVGTCTIGFKKKDLEGKRFDYFVISMGRVNRSLKLSGGVNGIVDFKQIYSTDRYAKNIVMGGRAENFVRIISAESVKH